MVPHARHTTNKDMQTEQHIWTCIGSGLPTHVCAWICWCVNMFKRACLPAHVCAWVCVCRHPPCGIARHRVNCVGLQLALTLPCTALVTLLVSAPTAPCRLCPQPPRTQSPTPLHTNGRGCAPRRACEHTTPSARGSAPAPPSAARLSRPCDLTD